MLNTKNDYKPSLYLQFIRLFKWARPYLFLLIIGLFCMFFEVFFNIAVAVIQERFIGAMETGNTQLLFSLVKITSITVIVLLFILLTGYISRALANFFMGRDLSLSFLEKISFLPFYKAEKIHSGDLLSRLNTDLAQVTNLISFQFLDLFRNLLTASIAFLYMGGVDWKISIIVLLSGPIVFILTRFFDKSIYNTTKAINEKSGVIRTHIQETLQNGALVKAYNLQNTVLEKYTHLRQGIVNLQIKSAVLHGLLALSTELLTNLIMLTSSVAICLLAVRGNLSVGVLMSFILLIGRVQWPFIGLSKIWGSMQEGLAASERIFEIINQPVDNQAKTPVTLLETSINSNTNDVVLEFKNVDFEFDNNKPLFTDLNLKLYHGETVAIVGPSGSGKTTLARLCLGLYKPNRGSIKFFDYDMIEDGVSLRKKIAYVPQVTYLFSGSIRENISLGKDNVFDEEIIDAANKANAIEFIEKLPDGFDTNIGEQGSLLSGGQRQRLALARAFLKNAPLVILDEATSALDNENERLVQNAISKLCVERTALVVAHRLSTIKNADRILVLDQGRIIEEGTHDELLKLNGLYTKLYSQEEKAS